jgi:hypothetical protein
MGLKSTFVFEDRIALTSFAKEKNSHGRSSHVEAMTNHSGDVVYTHDPILFNTSVSEDDILIKSFHDELSMANPAKNFLPRDYVGIKSKLEKKYVNIRKKHSKDPSTRLKSLDAGEFKFIPQEWSEHETL